MNRILILAGTNAQAQILAHWHGMPRSAWLYVDDPRRLRGLRNGVLWLFGTWRTRRDASECITIARHCGLTILTIEDDRYVGGVGPGYINTDPIPTSATEVHRSISPGCPEL
jgi:hypothetical protein